MNCYSVKFVFAFKEFRNQKTKTDNDAVLEFCFDDLEGLTDLIWEYVKDRLKREIIFDGNVPKFSESVAVEKEDLNRFLIIKDRNKDELYLETLTSRQFVKWSHDEKPVQIQVHEYSNSVKTRDQFKTVDTELLQPQQKDRANAASESALADMVEILKDKHKFHYKALGFVWKQWADWIYKQPGHKRDTLIDKPPPDHMMHLFQTTQSDADALIQNIRDSLSIGEGINKGMKSELVTLRGSFSIILRLFQELGTELNNFDARLTLMENRVEITEENLELFEDAVGPEENQYGKEMFTNIADCEDTDHA